MPLEPEFLELMPDTLTVEVAAAPNLYGGPASYAAPVSYRCRVVHRFRMVRNVNGGEVVSSAQAWIAGTPGITVRDRVTLPDGTQPPVLAVERYPDESGPHHEAVAF